MLRVLLAGACLAGLLSACAVIDPVDSRYDTVGRSLARARDEAIFLNLVRASHDYPLSFTTVSNVTPSMTNTTSFGLPSFLLGPPAVFSTTSVAIKSLPSSSPGRDAIFGSTTASNATAVSTNFSVSTQETSAFYEGFLKPIDLTTLDYFIRQGYSREMLFWLFTDSVEIGVGEKMFGYRYDPPNDYGCPIGEPRHRCFIDFVQLATASGLTVEERTLQKASSGGGKGGGEGSGAGKTTTTVFPRFCFNPVLAVRAQNTMPKEILIQFKEDLDVPGTTFNPRCGGSWNPLSTLNTPQPDTFSFNVGRIRFKITPRSAYGVFEFLGAVMKAQREGLRPRPTTYIPPNREITGPPTLSTVPEDQDLIRVVHNGPGPCFSHTWFEDGEYCVPEDATTTKRIFGLLAQLIAIQTAAADLSITPIVRVIQ